MKAFLRLNGKIRPRRKLSVDSNQLSTLWLWQLIKYRALDKVRYLRTFLQSILVFVSCSAALAQESVVHTTPASQAEAITGIVTSTQTGEPLEGATVKIKNTNLTTSTNEKGEFTLVSQSREGVLEISFLGYQSKDASFNNTTQTMVVALEEDYGVLEEVVVNTGYQEIPRERATGSFEYVGKESLSRRISSNIMDKIENMASGFYTNHSERSPDNYTIRGRSTIYADATPLIVLNNFSYEGNVEDINPNDIENITILKDAAAASIWGARAGNGVIVITTKKGASLKPRIEFNTNYSFIGKPHVNELPFISSADFIDFEQELFELGFYKSDEDLNKQGMIFPPFTPVVELLRIKSDDPTSAGFIDRQIESYKNINVLDDLKRYFYQNSLTNRHSLNVSGSTPTVNYYFSTGLDNSKASLVGQENKRITLNTRNIIHLNEKTSIEAGINYLQGINKNGNNSGYNMQGKSKKLYPYAKLADENGNALPIDWNYTQAFIKSAEQEGLLDWEYKPLDDIYTRNQKRITKEVLLNLGANYQIHKTLNFSSKYQYQNTLLNINIRDDTDSYYTRDLINNYTQIENGIINRPIPLGDIIRTNYSQSTSHQGRVQLNYNNTWGDDHQISGIGGWEIRSLTSKGEGNNFYGYNANGSLTSTNMDFSNPYPQYYYGVFAQYLTAYIPNYQSISKKVDRYYSYYANASYVYKNKYALSGSARVDASNLFGVKINQKEVPLWSIGTRWQINKERFYNIDWLPYLVLRATYGLQGNISKMVSAYTTGRYDGYSTNTGLIYMGIQTPPNESLKWETIGQLNWGLDFKLKENYLDGSIEFYIKKGSDLLGSTPLDPTTGFAINDGTPKHYTNVAGMKGSGVDITLESRILNQRFSWTTNVLFNYTLSKVSKYSVPVSSFGNTYLADYMINPVIDKPIYSIYAFPWAGLDPANGNPQSYVDGAISSDFSKIVNETPLSDMESYSAQPTSFGSFRNTFSWKSLSFSFNITYQFGYYFRNTSVNYSQIMNQWNGHQDFSKRWKEAGDELNTNVPSFIYPNNTSRETFYNYSDILIEKADHIRLADITFDYTLVKNLNRSLPFESLTFSSYITNLGVLWKANSHNLDPIYVHGPKQSTSVSLGVRATF